MTKEDLKKTIAAVPDFPKPGILFRDITPVLKQPILTRFILDELSNALSKRKIDAIAGIESRGFLFGMSLADRLGVGFLPIRKSGKLPRKKLSVSYSLEYGSDQLEIHADDLNTDMRVRIHDDLLATAGTSLAASALIKAAGAEVDSFSFLVELSELNGRQRLGSISNFIETLVIF